MVEITPIENVKLSVRDGTVVVSGPKGELSRAFPHPKVAVLQEGGKIIIKAEDDAKKTRAVVGTIQSHITNMMHGVTKGWTYRLKMVYLHFPMTVKIEKDRMLIQNFVGERKPRESKIVGDSGVELKGDEIIVTGIDIEAVSQTAANLERATKIKNYDRRIFQDGIFITKKAE